jgi:hypothetical protein
VWNKRIQVTGGGSIPSAARMRCHLRSSGHLQQRRGIRRPQEHHICWGLEGWLWCKRLSKLQVSLLLALRAWHLLCSLLFPIIYLIISDYWLLHGLTSAQWHANFCLSDYRTKCILGQIWNKKFKIGFSTFRCSGFSSSKVCTIQKS